MSSPDSSGPVTGSSAAAHLDPLAMLEAAYGPSIWESAEGAKVPDNAWEFHIRKALNDAAYQNLEYVPYCSTMPVPKACVQPKFMWRRMGTIVEYQAAMAEALPDRENASEYRAPRLNLTLSDFEIVGHIGDGSFSAVVLAIHKGTRQQYAIKLVNKHLVLRNKMVDYIKNERAILDRLDHPGVIKLHFTFQDAETLYFGLEYCPGGDLYEQIKKKGTLLLEHTRFYAAEIVLILEYLRSKELVHRDLKPENLLLTGSGHLKLVDFGSAKAFFLPPSKEKTGSKARATSFVGTAEYVSPEVLHNQPLSYPADLWALGCIIYQMLTGQPPFKGASEYLTFQRVTDRDFNFPDDFPAAAKDLVDKLLVLEPDERLGAQGLDAVKAHDFFAGTSWSDLFSQDAPNFVQPSPPSAEAEALDWELTSLITQSTGGQIMYEKNPHSELAGSDQDDDDD